MRVIHKIAPKLPEIKPRKKVAAYARVSAESERMRHSLSAQVSYYSELIQKNPEWEYAGVYADYGISGTGMQKRADFLRMLSDAEAGKINIILTKSIQRFARNTVDLLNTVRHLRDIGVQVYFEKERIRSLSGEGELMLTILASFAQEESRSISENIKWAVRKKYEKGIAHIHSQIYGYRWEGDTLVVVPKEAAVVKRIFQNFLDGKSRLETEREFAAEGILTRNGCRWEDSNIRGVLTNVTYTGNMLLQKSFSVDAVSHKRKENRGELPQYFVSNTHEAIIDKETFDYVQEEMARRRKLGALANKSLDTCCFTGKIKCGICGRNYTHNRQMKRGSLQDGWVCGSHKIRGENCGAIGEIPDKILRKECAVVLGLTEFDENIFSDKVKEIVVPERRVLEFHMKDGEVITRRWVSTAKKDCWDEEYKNRQKAWMRNYMANGENPRYTPFTTRVRCAVCGGSFRRSTRKGKGGTYSYWRCAAKCRCESVREEDLRQIATEALGISDFDSDKFKNEIEYLEAGAVDRITVHFKDGRVSVFPWKKPAKRGMPHTEEWKEKMSKMMKEQWATGARDYMSDVMKNLRKERGEHWKEQ